MLGPFVEIDSRNLPDDAAYAKVLPYLMRWMDASKILMFA